MLVKVSGFLLFEPKISYLCIVMTPDWQRLLRREASAHGMCEENRRALESVASKADAIALYKKTIDWALDEGYPSLPVLQAHFSDCTEQGVFIDREFHGEILNFQQVYVFHNCKGTIRTGLNKSSRIIPMLYFANGCDMVVRSANEDGLTTRVPLYVFGDNRINAENSEDIVCKIYKFEVRQ